jgi:hypothetical protein
MVIRTKKVGAVATLCRLVQKDLTKRTMIKELKRVSG